MVVFALLVIIHLPYIEFIYFLSSPIRKYYTLHLDAAILDFWSGENCSFWEPTIDISNNTFQMNKWFQMRCVALNKSTKIKFKSVKDNYYSLCRLYWMTYEWKGRNIFLDRQFIISSNFMVKIVLKFPRRFFFSNMSDQKQLFLVVIKNGWHIRGLCRHLRVVHLSFLWKCQIARFLLMRWMTGNDARSGDSIIWPMSSLTYETLLI